MPVSVRKGARAWKRCAGAAWRERGPRGGKHLIKWPRRGVRSCAGRHVETWQMGRPLGVVFWGTWAIAGLERLPFPLYVHPDGMGPAARAEALRGLGGTGLSTDTSALASTAPLRMLGRAAWGPPAALFPTGWEVRECLSLQTV